MESELKELSPTATDDAPVLEPDTATVSEQTPFATPLFSGQRVAFVGRLGGMNRKEARKLIRASGGIMSDKVDPSVDVIVIGADELPLEEENHPLLESWVVQAAASGKLRVINETRFWQEMGLVDTHAEVCQLYTLAALAQLLELPVATVRRWYRRGLITPARKVLKLAYFDFQEVATARRIAKMIDQGASPAAIESKLSRLAQLYPGLQRPLSQLSVLVEGRSVLLRDAEGWVEPSGQRHFDFGASKPHPHSSTESSDDSGDGADGFELEADHESHMVHAFPSFDLDQALDQAAVDQLATPDEFIRLAVQLEDAGEVDAAIEVYRAQGLAFGPSADLSFRLAELLYQRNDLSAARERYYSAIELDETFVEARASLGCVLVELDQKELARSAFEGALDHHADYPDVHFHLAKLLESMDGPKAREHWQRFLELAPQSPWADEARESLEALGL